jgi:phosphoribosylformylglycinamidine (FGAM) synthase PurS component
VRTGEKYVITGNLTEEQIEIIVRRLLANEVIHDFVYSSMLEGQKGKLSKGERYANT